MTTLLLTHPGMPRPSDAAGTSRTARPDSRGQRGARPKSASTRWCAARRRKASSISVTLCHNEHYVDELRHIAPTERPGLYRRRHLDVAGHLGSGDARRRRRGGRDRCRDGGHARQRLRRDAPARPSRRNQQADGLLLLRQCRDRRAPRAAQIRHRPRRRGRFRRPSRQRHPGYFLGRPDRDVLLDAPDAAVSRHRRQAASAASTTPSSTRRWPRKTAAPNSAPRSRT